MTVWAILVLVVFGVVGLLILNQPEKKQELLSHDDCWMILENIIRTKVEARMQEYRVRDVSIIPKFEERVLEIAQDIVKSIGPDTFHNLERYYSRAFIIHKVSKDVQLFLMEYMREFGPK